MTYDGIDYEPWIDLRASSETRGLLCCHQSMHPIELDPPPVRIETLDESTRRHNASQARVLAAVNDTWQSTRRIARVCERSYGRTAQHLTDLEAAGKVERKQTYGGVIGQRCAEWRRVSE